MKFKTKLKIFSWGVVSTAVALIVIVTITIMIFSFSEVQSLREQSQKKDIMIKSLCNQIVKMEFAKKMVLVVEYMADPVCTSEFSRIVHEYDEATKGKTKMKIKIKRKKK